MHRVKRFLEIDIGCKEPLLKRRGTLSEHQMVLEPDEIWSWWAEYFWQLYKAEPPRRELFLVNVRIAAADTPEEETTPSLAEVREAVSKLLGGKSASVCYVGATVLKTGGKAMIHGLRAILYAVWQRQRQS